MAETIHVRGEGGGVHAMDLPLPEPIQQRLATGQLTRVNPDGSSYTGPAQEAVAAPPATRPGKAAPKAEWVGWAVAVHGKTSDEAEAMTKQDLVDLPDQPPAGGGTAAATASVPDGRPDLDAPKSEWINHVVARGLLSREDAANYTRDDLIHMTT
jgi:hypothetical protein